MSLVHNNTAIMMIKVMKAATKCPNLKTIILMQAPSSAQKETAQASNLVLLGMNEIEEIVLFYYTLLYLISDVGTCTSIAIQATT